MQADLRLYRSHIPHCWKSLALAQDIPLGRPTVWSLARSPPFQKVLMLNIKLKVRNVEYQTKKDVAFNIHPDTKGPKITSSEEHALR